MKFNLQLPPRAQVVVITDRRVGDLYGDTLVEELQACHEQVTRLTIPGDESCKNQQTKAELEAQMFRLGAQRDTLIVALGGGVVGDLSGFVAATFMRGIDYIQVPTTLLAMVDSSIGGKTGINNEFGKNLVGAIWHPIQIVRRPELLKTLDDDQFVNGLIEVIKIFLSHDAAYFELVETKLEQILQRDELLLEKIIARAVELKEAVVQRDEREKGERATLNLGHTVGHALELLSEYRLLHGFGVGLGLDLEARLAVQQGCLDPSLVQRIEAVLHRLGLGPDLCRSWAADQVWQAMQHDKKSTRRGVNYIALTGPGQVWNSGSDWTRPMEKADFERAYQAFMQG